MTGTAPADPALPLDPGWVGRDRAPGLERGALLARAAAAAEALAAGVPHALERLVAAAEDLDDALGADGAIAADPPGTGLRAPAALLARDDLGDLLVTLSAAGVDAEERARLALLLAARLRAAGAGP